MNSQLLGRALGTAGPEALQRAELTRRLHAIQAAPRVLFDGRNGQYAAATERAIESGDDAGVSTRAHRAGVNCIAIDRFEGRYLISGGAETSIKLWDLEESENTSKEYLNQPAAVVKRSASSHQYGITHLCFYPFDSLAFLSSSYDHKLKVYATELMTASATFDLDSAVYSHSLSPIADHLLVACATQNSAVRLADLRSGASTHSLAGHHRAVLSVAWSPHQEYILASGSSDGTARLWDIRRSANSLGVLDLEDSVGIVGEDGLGKNARNRERGKAHTDAVNGVVWTDDGTHLVTAGHDERVRVWNMNSGANALSHFGPIIKNAHLSSLLPLLVPGYVMDPGKYVMFYPNQKEILMFDLFEGTLLKRLRIPGLPAAPVRGTAAQAHVRSRTTSLAWRTGHVDLYSAHSDGSIRAWLPKTLDEAQAETEESGEGDDAEDESRKRKREALDEVFRDLTKQKITFT
ncbi:MAG: hypothetical protein LQ348_001839 [Seirophora lacunosa]|nr:MAG: hypothetical protein LQ348_001839 [Seirophora lacunosa]